MIETPRELDAVCTVLQNEYDVAPETCRAEVELFLDELAKQGAVAIGQPSAI